MVFGGLLHTMPGTSLGGRSRAQLPPNSVPSNLGKQSPTVTSWPFLASSKKSTKPTFLTHEDRHQSMLSQVRFSRNGSDVSSIPDYDIFNHTESKVIRAVDDQSTLQVKEKESGEDTGGISGLVIDESVGALLQKKKSLNNSPNATKSNGITGSISIWAIDAAGIEAGSRVGSRPYVKAGGTSGSRDASKSGGKAGSKATSKVTSTATTKLTSKTTSKTTSDATTKANSKTTTKVKGSNREFNKKQGGDICTKRKISDQFVPDALAVAKTPEEVVQHLLAQTPVDENSNGTELQATMPCFLAKKKDHHGETSIAGSQIKQSSGKNEQSATRVIAAPLMVPAISSFDDDCSVATEHVPQCASDANGNNANGDDVNSDDTQLACYPCPVISPNANTLGHTKENDRIHHRSKGILAEKTQQPFQKATREKGDGFIAEGLTTQGIASCNIIESIIRENDTRIHDKTLDEKLVGKPDYGSCVSHGTRANDASSVIGESSALSIKENQQTGSLKISTTEINDRKVNAIAPPPSIGMDYNTISSLRVQETNLAPSFETCAFKPECMPEIRGGGSIEHRGQAQPDTITFASDGDNEGVECSFVSPNEDVELVNIEGGAGSDQLTMNPKENKQQTVTLNSNRKNNIGSEDSAMSSPSSNIKQNDANSNQRLLETSPSSSFKMAIAKPPHIIEAPAGCREERQFQALPQIISFASEKDDEGVECSFASATESDHEDDLKGDIGRGHKVNVSCMCSSDDVFGISLFYHNYSHLGQ